MRWVFLTTENHERLSQWFATLTADDRLPGYIEVYLRDVLGIDFERIA